MSCFLILDKRYQRLVVVIVAFFLPLSTHAANVGQRVSTTRRRGLFRGPAGETAASDVLEDVAGVVVHVPLAVVETAHRGRVISGRRTRVHEKYHRILDGMGQRRCHGE